MRRGRTALAALLIAVAAAGCGGNGEGGGGVASAGGAKPKASASAAAADPAAAGRKFAQCMRDEGIDMPDPQPGGGIMGNGNLRNQPGFAKALEKCRSLLPNGGVRSTDPAQLEQLRAFAKCMREHGVDMPDPQPDSAPFGQGQINRDDPAVKTATDACRDKLPARPGR